MSIRIYLHLIIVLLILINLVSAFKVLEPGELMDSSTIIEDDLYVCEDTVIISNSRLDCKRMQLKGYHGLLFYTFVNIVYNIEL